MEWIEYGHAKARRVSGRMAHWHISEQASERTNKRYISHAYIRALSAHVIQHSVQLCAPFSVYFNSYSWRFLHDHNIEKPNADLYVLYTHAHIYRFRIVILWTDRQWF